MIAGYFRISPSSRGQRWLLARRSKRALHSLIDRGHIVAGWPVIRATSARDVPPLDRVPDRLPHAVLVQTLDVGRGVAWPFFVAHRSLISKFPYRPHDTTPRCIAYKRTSAL